MSTFHHLLVAADLQGSSRRVVDLAVGLAAEHDAALTLVHVFEVPAWSYGALDAAADLVTPLERCAEKLLATELAHIHETLPRATSLLQRGLATDALLDAARRLEADLIVMGTHGRDAMSRLVMGSVAAKVVRLSPVPVLTLRTED